MVITRQNRSIIIEANDSVNMEAVQRLIDYINILEIMAKNQGIEEQAAELAREVEANWWKANKSRFPVRRSLPRKVVRSLNKTPFAHTWSNRVIYSKSNKYKSCSGKSSEGRLRTRNRQPSVTA